MKTVLLCSSNPLLVKSLYGMIRDEGYAVEEVEHPALAVQKVLAGTYEFMIVDAEPFGLSAGDAARIVASIAPAMPILCVGEPPLGGDLPLTQLPDDLDATKRMIHRIAAGDRTTTAAEGRPACSRRM
jgi:hypothetical protein